MTGIELLLFSTVLAASPTTPTPWFLADDYPVKAFERRQQGATTFELLVSPEGRPVGCTVEQSSGHELLDDRACLIATKRPRFAPALVDGRPVHGVYRGRVSWALDPDNWKQMEPGPDLEVSVSRLPDGATGPIAVKFAYAVDPHGKALSCTAAGPAHPKALDTIGCQQVLERARRGPVTTANGEVVTTVRTAWITFTQ